ncbi:MAG: RIP metalloprotease RseP, partial [Candidatus Eisenbacteria bacterium]|nr:RIP metalloprotease RseP [Candidatus Eisenbacteria bacterium]
MTTIIFGLLVFSVLVIIHEWGHFAVARWVGVRVERFSVGFGPVVFSKTWRGVQYVISALPLGGYVKMSGDDPRDRDALQPDDFFAVSWWRRVLIALAGPGANFLLAIVLGIVLAWVGITSPDAPNEIGSVDAGSVAAEVGFQDGDVVIAVDDQPVTARSGFVLGIVERENPGDASVTVLRDQSEVTLTVPESAFTDLFTGLRFPFPPIIGDVAIGTPAYSAGLKVGDRVTSINDNAIESWTDMTELIRSNPDQEIQLGISREDKNFIVPVVPMGVENNGEVTGRLGIGATSEQTFTRRFGFGEGVVVGTRAALMAVGMTFQSIGSLVTGGASLSQVSGPVAII